MGTPTIEPITKIPTIHKNSVVMVPTPPDWVGVRVRTRGEADELIPKLLDTPAKVRFVWCQLWSRVDPFDSGFPGCFHSTEQPEFDHADCTPVNTWVIASCGEWPVHPDWLRSIRDGCQDAHVPFFFAGWGPWLPISEMSDDAVSRLYKPNRKAKKHEDQAAIDELYGRYCIHATTAVRFDGKYGSETNSRMWEVVDGKPGYQAFRVGEQRSGRILDGRTHDEMPVIGAVR